MISVQRQLPQSVRLISTAAVLGDITQVSPVDTKKTGVNGETVPEPSQSGLLQSFKAGTGGRSSFSGNVVTVFGATGFLGSFVVNRIAKDGTQMIIPHRCDSYHIRHLRISGDLGQILFYPYDARDETSIRKAVKYSNVVLNLIGANYETGNYSYYDTHREVAARIAKISKEMGVERFIHLSALNASPDPEERVLIPGGSHFLRSKAAGEDAVRQYYPNATIIRPASVFGEDDRFMIAWMSMVRNWPYGAFDVYRKGEHTYKMPVYKNDVAAGIAKVVADRSWDGQTLEFVGPQCLKLSEMIDYVRDIQFNSSKPVFHKRHHGYTPITHIRHNMSTLWARFIKRPALYSWELSEINECINDRLSGDCALLSDVLTTKPLSKFANLARIWASEQTKGRAPWHRYHTDPLPPVNSYPLMYRANAKQEPVDFRTFDQTITPSSPFATA